MCNCTDKEIATLIQKLVSCVLTILNNMNCLIWRLNGFLSGRSQQIVQENYWNQPSIPDRASPAIGPAELLESSSWIALRDLVGTKYC